METKREESLHEQVYAMIKTAIMAGRYKPGEKLTVRGVKKEFGISETPVRAALNRLGATGELTQLSTSGSMAVPRVTAAEFEEVMLLRAHMEELAVIRAFPHVDETVISKLKEIVDRASAQYPNMNLEADLDYNYEFKQTIYAASGSPTLLKIINMLWMRVGPSLRYCSTIDLPALQDTYIDNGILRAIEDGDAPKAARLVSGNIINGMVSVLSSGALDEID
ncbi:MAG: GntR family transcriptional regulator [Pseudomonadota bacterium]